ncbi:MAG: hypothetical protein GX915_08150 [Clostridiales bacterium]|nr:hypothetical protein [Clostridiales bacterium]
MFFHRINEGRPIIQPSGEWEMKGTDNSCALFLERSQETDEVIENIIGNEMMADKRIRDGIVISLYPGVGIYGDSDRVKQHRCLAIFTPEMELLKKLAYPIMSPPDDPDRIDSVGIEDVRLSYIENIFYAWYCGYNGKDGAACVAWSKDLLNWNTVAPLLGNINNTYNKDHVVFPEKINGKWCMLHRPWGPKIPNINDMVIRLAFSENLLGPWEDAGEIIRGLPQEGRTDIWAGAGPCPIALGDNRYLLLYHIGSYFPDGYRQYDGCAALLDFNRFNPESPQSIVVKRLESIMIPATEWEINNDKRIDIIFPLGNYIYKGNLVVVYGAGDKCTCAAKIPFDELLDMFEIEKTDITI